MWANEVRSPDSGAAAIPTRVLHFPQDQSVGVVYLQDEDLVIPDTIHGFHSGYTYAERENFSCARGDVHIPAGKRVILTIRVATWVSKPLSEPLTVRGRAEPNKFSIFFNDWQWFNNT